MNLLSHIRTPADIRDLSIDQLEQLAGELRHEIFAAVSTNGGHLASNLGVVDLTLALHYVYDFGPYPTGPDWLLWDVGHQCYPHKMLTGRLAGFDQLRKRDGNSGFPSPEESPYDLFSVGHAGSAVSSAVGVARGLERTNRKGNVVAVVGDASIVNGLSFEGLNNAGTLNRQLLIILNDNGMSISAPQGAFAQYLERVRVSTTYDEAKKAAERVVKQLPGPIHHTIEAVWHHLKDALKSTVWPGQIFETLGLKYFGPTDGHDLDGLINTLAEIRHVQKPVLLHVRTIKGKGHDLAAQEPTKFHSPASFKFNGCELEVKKSSGKTWTSAFADALTELANDEPRLVAMTAAMPDGTGLSKFAKAHPERFIDTGICESHLVAMSAGMAKAGLRPVASIYSTFMQRAFDQVWQEVTLNALPVVFCMDRAGFVGGDGAVHHGFMDQSFLRPMPGMVLMAPSDEPELQRALKLALSLETASAIRYPRADVPSEDLHTHLPDHLAHQATGDWQVGVSRVLREGDDACIISYGALTQSALDAAELLSKDGVECEVIDARFCKPLDEVMVARVLASGRPVVTLEDHGKQNGFGSAVLEFATGRKLSTTQVTLLGIPDRLIPHMSRDEQLAEAGLDATGIVQAVRDGVRAHAANENMHASTEAPL